MTISILFLTGIGITLLTSLSVVMYVTRPLRKILIELCGSGERAEFWLAFSNVAFTLAPLIFAASCPPDPRGPAVVEIAGQLKWGFVGLLTSLVIVGLVISRFIPRARDRWTAVPQPSTGTQH